MNTYTHTHPSLALPLSLSLSLSRKKPKQTMGAESDREYESVAEDEGAEGCDDESTTAPAQPPPPDPERGRSSRWRSEKGRRGRRGVSYPLMRMLGMQQVMMLVITPCFMLMLHWAMLRYRDHIDMLMKVQLFLTWGLYVLMVIVSMLIYSCGAPGQCHRARHCLSGCNQMLGGVVVGFALLTIVTAAFSEHSDTIFPGIGTGLVAVPTHAVAVSAAAAALPIGKLANTLHAATAVIV